MSRLIAFLDLETTGLEAKSDFILEVAWQLTDNTYSPVSDPKTFLVDHGSLTDEVYERIESVPFVHNMHTQSGLLVDMRRSYLDPMEDIITMFVEDVLEHKGDATVHLGGYSVDFDRGFLKEQPIWNPVFTSSFYGFQMNHRLLDLSANKMMWDSAGRKVPSASNDNPHRALDDVLETVEFAQLMREDLMV